MQPTATTDLAHRATTRKRMNAKFERTMLGLAVSALTLKPGQSRSQKELAAFCECSPQAIAETEHRACQKIRLALRRRYGLLSTTV